MKSVLASQNLTIELDDNNQIRMEVDGNRILSKKGDRNAKGEPRKYDQVSLSGGWLLMGPYMINLNISRA